MCPLSQAAALRDRGAAVVVHLIRVARQDLVVRHHVHQAVLIVHRPEVQVRRAGHIVAHHDHIVARAEVIQAHHDIKFCFSWLYPRLSRVYGKGQV
jgi:hypothetical protein